MYSKNVNISVNLCDTDIIDYNNKIVTLSYYTGRRYIPSRYASICQYRADTDILQIQPRTDTITLIWKHTTHAHGTAAAVIRRVGPIHQSFHHKHYVNAKRRNYPPKKGGGIRSAHNHTIHRINISRWHLWMLSYLPTGRRWSTLCLSANTGLEPMYLCILPLRDEHSLVQNV